MSVSACLYVGPYALWVDADPPGEDVLPWDVLSGHWSSMTKELQVAFSKGSVRGFCVVPSSTAPRAGGPTRTMESLNFWGYAALDLSDIDREAEVEAFRRAYERELAEMAAAIGSEPVLRWGVIFGHE